MAAPWAKSCPSGRALFRSRTTRPLAGVRKRQRQRRVATHRPGDRRTPSIWDDVVARNSHRCIRGKSRHFRRRAFFGRNSGRQHVGGNRRDVSHPTVGQRPRCVRPAPGCPALRAVCGGAGSGGQRHSGGRESGAHRARSLVRRRSDLADLVARRRRGCLAGRTGRRALGHEPLPVCGRAARRSRGPRNRGPHDRRRDIWRRRATFGLPRSGRVLDVSGAGGEPSMGSGPMRSDPPTNRCSCCKRSWPLPR